MSQSEMQSAQSYIFHNGREVVTRMCLSMSLASIASMKPGNAASRFFCENSIVFALLITNRKSIFLPSHPTGSGEPRSGIVPRSGTAPLEVSAVPLVPPRLPVLVLWAALVDDAEVEVVVAVSLALVGSPDPKLVVAGVGEHAARDRAESAVVMAFMAPPSLNESAAAD